MEDEAQFFVSAGITFPDKSETYVCWLLCGQGKLIQPQVWTDLETVTLHSCALPG